TDRLRRSGRRDDRRHAVRHRGSGRVWNRHDRAAVRWLARRRAWGRAGDLRQSCGSTRTLRALAVQAPFTRLAYFSTAARLMPFEARSVFHRSPTLSSLSGTVLIVKSSRFTPRLISSHVNGVE